MAHVFKFIEVGQATKNGKRFIDRTLIGNKPAKVLGVNFYQKKQIRFFRLIKNNLRVQMKT